MNTASTLRGKLHQYIDVADEQKIQAIYVLLEDEIDYRYSAQEIDMFHKRREQHLDGTSKSYTAEESINIVRQQKK